MQSAYVLAVEKDMKLTLRRCAMSETFSSFSGRRRHRWHNPNSTPEMKVPSSKTKKTICRAHTQTLSTPTFAGHRQKNSPTLSVVTHLIHVHDHVHTHTGTRCKKLHNKQFTQWLHEPLCNPTRLFRASITPDLPLMLPCPSLKPRYMHSRPCHC